MARKSKIRKPTLKGRRTMSAVTSVRFPVELLEKLNAQADARDIYTSALINEILQAHVARAARKPAAAPSAALFG